MKLIITTLISAACLCFTYIVNANTTKTNVCNTIASCYTTQQTLLQHKKLQLYPQYAHHDRYNNRRDYQRRYNSRRYQYRRDYYRSNRKRYSWRFPRRIASSGERLFIFSPRIHQWAAYDEYGRRVARGRANGGSTYCRDLRRPCRTPQGVYRVYSKGTVECKSSKFPMGRGGAPMPYCMFFHRGYAIHGSPYISNVNGSHGCIRVTTRAARWLHRYFLETGTKVKVLSY